jgi:hypothetical protein
MERTDQVAVTVRVGRSRHAFGFGGAPTLPADPGTETVVRFEWPPPPQAANAVPEAPNTAAPSRDRLVRVNGSFDPSDDHSVRTVGIVPPSSVSERSVAIRCRDHRGPWRSPGVAQTEGRGSPVASVTVMTSTVPGTSPSENDRADPVDPVQDSVPDAVPDPMPTPSLRWPAFIILGIAVFILVGGIAASVIATSGPKTLTLRSVTLPDATVVHLTPAATALQPIISSGEPPADILASLAVPLGSVRRHWVDTDQNQTQYDRSVSFTTQLSSEETVAFYRALLIHLGWKILFVGPGAVHGITGTEVLGKRGSGDGFYWEVGAIVPPSTSSGVTPFTLLLFEIPDTD